jgi:ribosomal protein L11 methyltransferase
MFTVRVPAEPDAYDSLIASLWEAGTTGIIDGPGYVDAFFDDRASAHRFGEPMEVVPVDWVHQIEESWTPVLVGQKFFVVAPWRKDPTPPGRFRLEINPGTQFGTGRHPCTQLCLEALEKAVRPGDSVLDVGSGSGILSVAAKLLGAGRVVACDIESDSAHPVPFFQGSVDAVRSNTFDIVVANINDAVLHEMRPDLERVARVRILSGFQDDNGNWSCLVV